MFIIFGGLTHFLVQVNEVNAVYNIEDTNPFVWQKYMNEDEFNQLENGMSYMEVVEIAKGRGEQLKENVFIWNDELLMTKAYEIHFEEDRLVEKKVIKKRGYSSR